MRDGGGSDSDGDKNAEPAPDGGTDDRSTERRIAAAFAAGESETRDADVTTNVALAAGLIRERKWAEARAELEATLVRAPGDAKTRDLLALVYFRLALYPDAIELYEHLRDAYPRDAAVKVNLALSYLKASHLDEARAELEEVVRTNPHHRRAWGYLGLAYERLGLDDLALRSYERGQLTEMSVRLHRTNDRLTVPVPAGGVALTIGRPKAIETPAPRETTTIDEVPDSYEHPEGFEELDSGELEPSLAQLTAGEASVPRSYPQAPSSGEHDPIPLFDPGDIPVDEPSTAPPPGPAPAPSTHAPSAPPTHAPSAPPTHVPLARVVPGASTPAFMRTMGSYEMPVAARPPPIAPATDAAWRRLFVFPPSRGVTRDSSGVVLVRVGGDAPRGRPDAGFAARLEAVRTFSSTLKTGVVSRQTRGRSTSEPFGGFTAPLVRFDGDGEVVLGARSGHTLLAIELADDVAQLREDLIAAFALDLAYENLRAPLEDGDGTAMAELRGSGSVVLEGAYELRALQVRAGRTVCARREVVAGWTGAVVARTVPTRDAPAAQPGLLTFEGEGFLLVSAR